MVIITIVIIDIKLVLFYLSYPYLVRYSYQKQNLLEN